ncbi:MAG TPA: hypothetical protein V6C52_10795 [Coleofasciculaceae cyanobacterium]|jgi:hypothetical protein
MEYFYGPKSGFTAQQRAYPHPNVRTKKNATLQFGEDETNGKKHRLAGLVLLSQKNQLARDILKHLDLNALIRAESPEEVKNRLRDRFIAENPITKEVQTVSKTDSSKTMLAEAIKVTKKSLVEYLPENEQASNLWSQFVTSVKKWRHR